MAFLSFVQNVRSFGSFERVRIARAPVGPVLFAFDSVKLLQHFF